MACVYCENTFGFGCVNGITTCGICNTVQPKKEDIPLKCENCNKEGPLQLQKFPKSQKFFTCEYPFDDCILDSKWMCLDCKTLDDKKWDEVEKNSIKNLLG